MKGLIFKLAFIFQLITTQALLYKYFNKGLLQKVRIQKWKGVGKTLICDRIICIRGAIIPEKLQTSICGWLKEYGELDLDIKPWNATYLRG